MINLKHTFHFSHTAEQSEIPDSPDKPPTAFVSAIVVLSFAFVLAVILGTYTLLWKSTNSDSQSLITGMGNQNRLTYLQQQKEILSHGKTFDKNHFQIPIDEAMNIVIKKQGLVQFSTPSKKKSTP